MNEPWRDAVRPMRRVGHAIEAHATIGSTNDRARELLNEADGDGRVVVAEEQTAGRGRRGRRWLSPPGTNLMVSVALRPRLPATDAWKLGLAAALAAVESCRHVAPIGLKWPNDLVADDARKVGGLLVETMAEDEQLTGAVLGFGINVNWRRGDMPAEIADGATSLRDLAGADVDRVPLLRRLLDALEAELTAIEAGRSPLERYRAACTTLGQVVRVETPDGTVEGRAVDLDPTGALVVATGDGARHVLASGEVVRVRREVPV
jgi:BirA family biotin operon repressor/biotin-[acetyl-CoA-carboxylase] ligase